MFDKSIKKHIDFLYQNLENQKIYGSKFSEIIQNMDIFDAESEFDIKIHSRERSAKI